MTDTEPPQVVNVTQKRGCTCCGTGCGIVALLPLLVAALWSLAGGPLALSVLALATILIRLRVVQIDVTLRDG